MFVSTYNCKTLPTHKGLKHCLKRIKIRNPTSTQAFASYVVMTLKGGFSSSPRVISPLCADMPAACLSSGSRAPQPKRLDLNARTHLDRVGSADSLTWGRRAQHSSTGCKVAGAM